MNKSINVETLSEVRFVLGTLDSVKPVSQMAALALWSNFPFENIFVDQLSKAQ